MFDGRVEVCRSIEDAVKDADAIIIATEYSRFNDEDWEAIAGLVREKLIFDGRNVLDKNIIAKHRFEYHGIGR